ncbi:olfactory receptor 51G1-like [Pelmatolapia mariae]|uniref:olfactory receptor 51G1-like n=1 Tax=Pelmatolapia mariae TaxID=158779 RepID=UPI003211E1C5
MDHPSLDCSGHPSLDCSGLGWVRRKKAVTGKDNGESLDALQDYIDRCFQDIVMKKAQSASSPAKKSPGEDAEATVKSFIKIHLKLPEDTVKNIDFDRVHRLGGVRSRTGRPRPIVAKFGQFKQKEQDHSEDTTQGDKIQLIINSSKVSYFTLAAYFDTSTLKYFCFTVVMSLYLLILCANVLLIVVICVNRSLHEPMYMFLCSLFVNELYGSTGLFPFLLLQILSDVHTVSAPLCFLQIFCVFSYVCVEFCTLAVMSYDRYLAICCPLQYHTRMTPATVVLLIALSWLYSFLTILTLILLIAPLELCGNVINKVYCLNYSIVKLACSETTANNIYGLFITALTVFVPVILILCSYVRILKVCFSGSKQTRQKAVSTCTPHLSSLLNFSFGVCFEVIQSRFSLSSVHSMVHIVLSLYFLTCQPLFNPVLYGLNMSNIRKRLFAHKRR